LGRVRAVEDAGTRAPATNGGLADAELGCELRGRLRAGLNVGALLRRGRRVGVQVQLHDPRRSLIYEMPRSTPIPSTQSPGTKHQSGDPYTQDSGIDDGSTTSRDQRLWVPAFAGTTALEMAVATAT